MYKLVVLCSLLAAVAAKPGALIAPLAYSHAYVAPATTTITHQASSVVHPSPLLYTSPLAYTHFIKKRSAQLALSPYFAPTTYAAGPLLASSYSYSTPLVHSAPLVHASPYAYTGHFIKKRSAQFALASYIAPTTYSGYHTTYAASPYAPLVHSAPIIASAPITYSHHFIKKRSAPLALATTYLAPTSVSHQSRIDLHSSPVVTTFASPYAYHAPLAYSHIY